jgi:hypothetical protein
MITPTIKATSVVKLIERIITKKLSGCARSWLVLDFKIKEREISLTNALTANRDEQNSRFQFGQHLDGWMWNEKEERIYHGVGNILEDIRNNFDVVYIRMA